jgi:GGDEF domain-containing protein
MFQIPALNTLPTPEARLDFLNQQLRIVATSAAQAKARGDQADLDRLLGLYNRARADAITLRGQANDADQPSQFMLALDRFSDDALGVGKDAFGLVKAVGVSTLLVVVGLLVVLGIGFKSGAFKLRL